MQFEYILFIFACGWVMGIVFDFYNTVTGSSKWLRWLRPLLDILFWCLSGAFVYYLTFITDSGRFRIYTFGLVAAGYFVYRLLLHHFVVSSAFAVVRFVAFILALVWRVIDWLILAPLRVVWRVVRAVARSAYWTLFRLENICIWICTTLLRPFSILFQVPWRRAEPWRRQIDGWMEGMFAQMSKWLKHRHDAV